MIEYITFLGQTIQTAPCFGEDILSVAEGFEVSDPSVMEGIIGELDSSSQFYSETTARKPRPTGPYVIDVRATIASLAETHGAGCALIARADLGNNVPFCEIGRAVHSLVTGFGTVKPNALEGKKC
jgi:hypothetical protein